MSLKLNGASSGHVILDAKANAGSYTLTLPSAGNGELVAADSSGNITISNGNLIVGTAGKGIDFSATPNSSGANHGEILTDYESGTFTPTYHNGTVTYSAQYGYYIRVGNLVHVWFDMTIASCSSQTGVPWIGGFPFSKVLHNSQNYYEGITWWILHNNFVNSKPVANGYMGNNETGINMYYGETNHLHGGTGGASWVVNQTGRMAGCLNYTAG